MCSQNLANIFVHFKRAAVLGERAHLWSIAMQAASFLWNAVLAFGTTCKRNY